MIATAWAGIVKFFTNNPIARWIGALFLFLIGWEIVKRHLKEAGRDAERIAIARKQAEEYARTVETVNTIGQETGNAKDRAIAAPDAVTDVSSADELRERYPDNAAVILRPRPAGGGEGSR